MLTSRLLLVIGLLRTTTDALVSLPTATSQHAKPLKATSRGTDEERSAALRFSGDLSFASAPVATSRDVTARGMSAFLRSADGRTHLLGAGGTRRVEVLPSSPALQRRWRRQVDGGFAPGLPERPDAFLRTNTTIEFPGLTLTNTVVNGVAIVYGGTGEQKATEATECASVLIGESRTTTGTRPLVWLFNRLTGDGATPAREYSDPKARVATRAAVFEDPAGGTAAFRIAVRFEVRLRFPRRLLRLLPVPRAAMEARGSAAIERALAKDFAAAVDGVREGFLESTRASPPHVATP